MRQRVSQQSTSLRVARESQEGARRCGPHQATYCQTTAKLCMRARPCTGRLSSPADFQIQESNKSNAVNRPCPRAPAAGRLPTKTRHLQIPHTGTSIFSHCLRQSDPDGDQQVVLPRLPPAPETRRRTGLKRARSAVTPRLPSTSSQRELNESGARGPGSVSLGQAHL